MGTTRIEQAIDNIDPLGDELAASCDDIRLAWLAHEMTAECAEAGGEFDALWINR
jgi:hypothetical protein